MKNNIYRKIYEVVLKIPKGKLTTYGEIGKTLKISPRIVGWALHANINQQIPCHRVVNKEGFIATKYAFGGEKEQRRKLKNEGITFKSLMQTEINKHQFLF